jgi:hypothetical protein
MQKTINGTIIVITLLSTIGTHLKAGNFDGMMTLRVNDHEYKVKDIISPRIINAFYDSKDSIESMAIGDIYDIGPFRFEIEKFKLKDKISRIEFGESENENETNLFVIIPIERITAFDKTAVCYGTLYMKGQLIINAKLRYVKDEIGLALVIDELDLDVTNITASYYPAWWSHLYGLGFLCDLGTVAAAFTYIWPQEKTPSGFSDLIGTRYELTDLYKNYSSQTPATDDPDGEIQAMINSFPVNVGFEYYDGNSMNINSSYIQVQNYKGLTIDIETIQTSIYNLINPELNIVNNELLVVTGPFYVNYQSDCLGGDYGEDGDCDDTGEEPQFFPERGGIKEMFGNIIYLYVEGSGTAVLRWFDMGNSVETG